MINKGNKTYVRNVLSILLLATVILASSVSVSAADDTYPSWGEYAAAKGYAGSYTNNDVVDGIEEVMNAAAAAYRAGDAEGALGFIAAAKNDYWGASGLKISMQKKLPSAAKKTAEADFTKCNSIIKNSGTPDEFDVAKDVLVADLRLSANKLDGVEEDIEIAEEKETGATALFKENYYADWASYSAAAGLESGWTWNDVADAMSEVFRTAKAKYAEGDMQGAYDCINNGYYGYYETTGFERNAMGYISGARKSEVELQFSACKAATKGGTEEEFVKNTDILRTMIRTDANKLDGVDENGNETAGGRSAAVAKFIACFTIILREGFEAILVVGAIIAYLLKTTKDLKKEERDKQLMPVYAGSVLGIILSFVSAWALNALKLANSASQEVIEGVTALIAVAVLFYVSNWMVSKSESEVWDAYIKSKVKDAATKGSSFALAFTSFLAVYREGAEVILFYQPLLGGEDGNMVWLGFAAGCVCLVFVYLAIRLMSVRLPLKPFFLATSILMAVMSIAFLGSGIKELIEGDVITMTSPAWVAWIPSNSLLEILGIYPCVQTVVPQLILTAVTIVTFIFWLKKNRKMREELAASAEVH
ncbi:MAG: FTR1 family iron permease [Lachnospiraceae bacterium]|nr:FTR1 family iron permease [Lachnospiraceae bacterium]